MKKLSIMALTAIAALSLGSCGNSTPKADLNNEIDSLSYAIGMAQSNGLSEYLTERMGVDSTYVDAFIKGLNEGVNAGDDKKKAAYFAGIQIGQQISGQMIKGINTEIFGNDTTKTISMKNFMAGFISGYTGKNGKMTMDQAGMFAQEKMNTMKNKSLMEKYGKNKQAGEAFLAKNKTADGVKMLPSGVQYKIVKEGTGAVPTDTSRVKVHYEGTLLNGTVFDSSYKRNEPAVFSPQQVIKGWGEVLKSMPVGSVWEVWIPQELAYGAQEMGQIEPFSCLHFKIELISIEK